MSSDRYTLEAACDHACDAKGFLAEALRADKRDEPAEKAKFVELAKKSMADAEATLARLSAVPG